MASRPVSPAESTKKHLPPIQPNAHPYAIKTTSSALLSRSNSSPHSAHHIRHNYVPTSPSRIPTITRVRHRHSSSLSLVEAELRGEVRTGPAPLPIPPSVVVASSDNPSVSSGRADEPKLTHRVRRAETMPPGSATPAITGHRGHDQNYPYSHDQGIESELYAGLPSNPKQWSTYQLTTYLETSLRSENNTDGDKDDSSLMDIVECVRTRGLTGRELLRLTDADLAGTPLSDMQRAQLLEHSRTLRADVLRGRIYVDSYHSHEVSDHSNEIYSRSAHSYTPFNNIRGASVSVDDLRLLLDNNTRESAFPPSPAMSLHRSNSVSDASAQRYRDLARMRMRRRGKVKGLVESWERASTSGSECSASEQGSVSESEAESESEIEPEVESISGAKCLPESLSDLPSALHDESLHDVRTTLVDSTSPYIYMNTALEVVGDEEEEPSIEELLASSSSIPLKGARAWEADFGLGETVKRIPVSLNADADNGQKIRGDSIRSKRLGARGSTGSRGKNSKTQKRVVTAIFTGSPTDDASKNVGGEMNLVDHHRHASGVNGVVRDKPPAGSDLQNDSDSALRALEESITVTRTQMEAFRLRLEEVEADTAKQEAVLEPTQRSDSRHSSEFESRQRRSDANEQAKSNTADPRNRDVLEGWETMSMGEIARAIVARAMGWVFPYEHVGASAHVDQDRSRARTGSRSGVNNRYPSPAKRGGRLSVARMSCSIILVSFAICAAVLRRMGFGRWVRRP
ncbi:hypothetical protein J3R82DRAFT_11101 [Butyriboletus roseoflavus]|nr:hypothetical protein J3R82DRAFT_11101 [Butyriboletus roseoflavus]